MQPSVCTACVSHCCACVIFFFFQAEDGIRDIGVTGVQTCALPISSGDRPGDLARSRELRINAHLLKPVLQDELLETIYRVMSRARGDPATAVAEPSREPAPVPVPAAAPLHILVAEDNEFGAQLMEQLLARRGHQAPLATNGRGAPRPAGKE